MEQHLARPEKEQAAANWPAWCSWCWSSSLRWSCILPSAGWGCTCRRNSSWTGTSPSLRGAAAWSGGEVRGNPLQIELQDPNKMEKNQTVVLPYPREWSRIWPAPAWRCPEGRTCRSGWGSSSHSGRRRRPGGGMKWLKSEGTKNPYLKICRLLAGGCENGWIFRTLRIKWNVITSAHN